MNSKLQYPWPKTQGFISGDLTTVDKIKKLIYENPDCFLSEKLDGCNFCVSSEGYVASRNVVVAKNAEELKSAFFNKVSLSAFIPLLAQVKLLNVDLANKLELSPAENNIHLETLLYGELILKGTSQSTHDVYQYEARNIKPGKFYVFGIGLVLHPSTNMLMMAADEMELMKKAKDKVHKFFEGSNYSLNRSVGFKKEERGEKKYFVVPLNFKVKNDLLDPFNIPTVHMKSKQESLFNILTRKQIKTCLKLRKVEGYIVNTPQMLLKLKYRTSKDERRDEFLDQLSIGFPFNDGVKSLEEIYDSCLEYCPLTSVTANEFKFWYYQVVNDFGLENLKKFMTENIDEVGIRCFSDDTKAIMRIFLKRITLQIGKEHFTSRLDPHLKADLKAKLEKRFMNLILDEHKRMSTASKTTLEKKMEKDT